METREGNGPPSGQSRPGEFRFLAIDVETANSHRGSICQIGLCGVRIDGGLATWSSLVNPRQDFDGRNIAVHGITPRMVEDAPRFPEVLAAIAPLLAGLAVVQHSRFDELAMKAAASDWFVALPPVRWVDSVQIARRAWPEFTGDGGHGLANLALRLGLDFEHHDAAEDARATAEVVLRAERHTGLMLDDLLAPLRRSAFPQRITAEGAADGPLAGEVACFTGSLSIPRQIAAARAAAAGITVTASVSRRTTLLIVGDQDLSLLAGHAKSAKHRQAEEMIAQGAAIRIVGEHEFLRMLDDPRAAGIPAPARPAASQTRQKPPTGPTEGRIVVFASALVIDMESARARAEAAGFTVMANITKRTAFVIVADGHVGAPRTFQHRQALERAAAGQPLSVIGESEFLRMLDGG